MLESLATVHSLFPLQMPGASHFKKICEGHSIQTRAVWEQPTNTGMWALFLRKHNAWPTKALKGVPSEGLGSLYVRNRNLLCYECWMRRPGCKTCSRKYWICTFPKGKSRMNKHGKKWEFAAASQGLRGCSSPTHKHNGWLRVCQAYRLFPYLPFCPHFPFSTATMVKKGRLVLTLHMSRPSTRAVSTCLRKVGVFFPRCSFSAIPEDQYCCEVCHVTDSSTGFETVGPQVLQQRPENSRNKLFSQILGRMKTPALSYSFTDAFHGNLEAGSEAPAWLSSIALLSAWMNWDTYLVPGGKDVMSPSKSSQSSIKIPGHPHIACRWFVYSPGWITHPEIAFYVFCAQSAGVSINKTRHELLFQAIHYSLTFSAFEVTRKAVEGELRKVPNRPTY